MELHPRKRPKVVQSQTVKIEVGCGTAYVTVGYDHEGPFEVFLRLGRSGGCTSAFMETIGRLVSLNLRTGVAVKDIVDQLKGIRCPTPKKTEEHEVLSCPDAIAIALTELEIPTVTEVIEKEEEEEEKGG